MNTRNFHQTIIFMMIILSSCFVRPSQQLGIFDMYELYDGIQCSIQIVQLLLIDYNQPICCIFWKMKNFFETQGDANCDTPDNIRKLFSGEAIVDYVDFSKMDCSRYPENSPDCDRLWAIIITVLVGQIILFFVFFLTTILLTCWLCHLRRYRQTEKLMKAKLMMNDMETSSLSISDQFEDSDTETMANHSSMKCLIESINRNIVTINDYNPIKQQYDSDSDDQSKIANKEKMAMNVPYNLLINKNKDNKKNTVEKNIEIPRFVYRTNAVAIQGNTFSPSVSYTSAVVNHSKSDDNGIYNKVNDQNGNDICDEDNPEAKTNKQFDSMEDFV